MELLTRSRNWRVAIGQRRPAYGDVLGTGVHVQKVPRYQGTIKLYPCDWVGFFAQQASDTPCQPNRMLVDSTPGRPRMGQVMNNEGGG